MSFKFSKKIRKRVTYFLVQLISDLDLKSFFSETANNFEVRTVGLLRNIMTDWDEKDEELLPEVCIFFLEDF